MDESPVHQRPWAKWLRLNELPPSMQPPAWVTSLARAAWALGRRVKAGLLVSFVLYAAACVWQSASSFADLLAVSCAAVFALTLACSALAALSAAAIVVLWDPRSKFSLRTLTLFVLLATCLTGLFASVSRGDAMTVRPMLMLIAAVLVAGAFCASLVLDRDLFRAHLRKRRAKELRDREVA